MPKPAFPGLEPVRYRGPDAEGLAYRYYDKDRIVRGKRMEDQLRLAVCYWHTFCGDGSDVFGAGTFNRAWQRGDDAVALARDKAAAAFELFEKLGVPLLLLPRSRRRAGGVEPVGDPCHSRRDRGGDGRAYAADGRQASLGHREPLQPPALFGRGGDQSRTPTSLPTRPLKSKRRSRSPSSSAARITFSGAAGKATRPSSTPT
jgi:hypothetical protein